MDNMEGVRDAVRKIGSDGAKLQLLAKKQRKFNIVADLLFFTGGITIMIIWKAPGWLWGFTLLMHVATRRR